MRFIDWVHEERKEKKYHEIAADLGVHPSYLGHIKNGKFNISKKFAERVEKASGGRCKKEEIVFEVVDPKEWEENDKLASEEGENEIREIESTAANDGEDVEGDDLFAEWRRALL